MSDYASRHLPRPVLGGHARRRQHVGEDGQRHPRRPRRAVGERRDDGRCPRPSSCRCPTPGPGARCCSRCRPIIVYQLCLVRALQRGDLSLVFPVMRGAAPLLTAAAAFLLLHETLPPLALAGLVVATAAVFVFAAPPRGTLLRHHPDRAVLGWALATAVGVVALQRRRRARRARRAGAVHLHRLDVPARRDRDHADRPAPPPARARPDDRRQMALRSRRRLPFDPLLRRRRSTPSA